MFAQMINQYGFGNRNEIGTIGPYPVVRRARVLRKCLYKNFLEHILLPAEIMSKITEIPGI